jgi:hypothetical protein
MNRFGLGRVLDAAATLGAIGAVAATAHTLLNLRALRAPAQSPAPAHERVSVLVPMRDEADRVEDCLHAILAQVGVRELEVLVLDDGSTDDTLTLARKVAAADPRVRVLTGEPLPSGWLGKPHACAQLADAATGSVLVFVDADVTLEPHAVAATVELLRAADLDAVSPYPRQVAATAAERLVQPLLQWSWLTFLPLGAAESSPRESLVAANGQLFAVDADAYRRCGGHGAIRTEVLDDIALMRVVKRAGGRGVVADGTHLATCRMYDGWSELRPGYTKSLWSAFGSPAGAAATASALVLLYVIPPAAFALRGSRAGAIGTAAGIAGRVLVARRVGGRVWPDSLAHPASVATFAWLTAESVRGRRARTLSWKGRTLP